MNDQAVDKHSVNCYFCGELVDERDCVPADKHNGGDGGDCCRVCLKRRDISFESMFLTRGTLRVEWEWLGEGNSGDYDPADKDDNPLIRFTVSKRVPCSEERWEQIDDGSYCTQLPVTTSLSDLVKAAVSILEAAEQPSPKKRFEELSWLETDDCKPEPGALALSEYKRTGRTVPASNFVGTITANVDGKMSDADFRQFIRNTLPIVIYDYGDRFHPYEDQDQGKGLRLIEDTEQKTEAPGV